MIEIVLYLNDQEVFSVSGPLDIFKSVYKSAIEGRLSINGVEVEEIKNAINFGFKVGYMKNNYFGVKIRAGKEGNYYTHVWNNEGIFIGTIQSNYLTYYRTAALLLLYPYYKFPESVNKILIIGSGRLGWACANLAKLLFKESSIELLSRKQKPANFWRYVGDAKDIQLKYGEVTGEYDIVLTCTNSKNPLPINKVISRYIGVGGAVNNNRRELPDELISSAKLYFSDNPDKAKKKCGDVLLANKAPVLIDHILKKERNNTKVIGFICGTGGIDVELASEVITRRKNCDKPS